MTLAKMRAQNLCEWVGGGWCRDRTQFVQIKVKSSPAWMRKRKRIGGRELQGGEGLWGRGEYSSPPTYWEIKAWGRK